MKPRLSQLLAMAPAALAAITPMSAGAAAVDYFLKIDGIEGESADKAHSKEIQLDTFSFAASQSSLAVVGPGGGGSAGKASFADTTVTAKLSKASPNLYYGAATGTHFKSAVISARRSGDKNPTDFYTVKLEDIVISSVKTAGTIADGPGETVTMNFSKVTWSYRPQKPDGTLDAAVTRFWSLKESKGG